MIKPARHRTYAIGWLGRLVPPPGIVAVLLQLSTSPAATAPAPMASAPIPAESCDAFVREAARRFGIPMA